MQETNRIIDVLRAENDENSLVEIKQIVSQQGMLAATVEPELVESVSLSMNSFRHLVPRGNFSNVRNGGANGALNTTIARGNWIRTADSNATWVPVQAVQGNPALGTNPHILSGNEYNVRVQSDGQNSVLDATTRTVTVNGNNINARRWPVNGAIEATIPNGTQLQVRYRSHADGGAGSGRWAQVQSGTHAGRWVSLLFVSNIGGGGTPPTTNFRHLVPRGNFSNVRNGGANGAVNTTIARGNWIRVNDSNNTWVAVQSSQGFPALGNNPHVLQGNEYNIRVQSNGANAVVDGMTRTVVVTGNNINARRFPVSGAIEATIPSGSQLQVRFRSHADGGAGSGRWAQVQSGTHAGRWVSLQFVSDIGGGGDTTTPPSNGGSGVMISPTVSNRISDALGRGANERALSEITQIVIHHSANPTNGMHLNTAVFENHWRGNPAMGFPSDNRGGYHEVVLFNGHVEVNMQAERRTWGAAGQNNHTWHIAVTGQHSGGINNITNDQLNALAVRIVSAMRRFGWDASQVNQIVRHREVPNQATACNDIDITDIRNRVRLLLTPGIIPIGSLVLISGLAQSWATGQPIPVSMRGQAFRVLGIQGNNLILSGVTSAIRPTDVTFIRPPGAFNQDPNYRNILLWWRPDDEQSVIEGVLSKGVSYWEIGRSWILARAARDSAYDRARKEGIGNQGNHIDAYRHFNWTFNMARELNRETSRIIGDVHEIHGLTTYGGFLISASSTRVDAYFNTFTLQDLWNNSVGYNLGATDRHASMSAAYEYALNNNLLIRSVNDIERIFGIRLTHFASDNHPSARAVLNLTTNVLEFTGINAGISINFNTDTLRRR